MPRLPYFMLLLILVDIATAFVFNDSRINDDEDNEIILNVNKTRRQGSPTKGKSESTSSDGKRRPDDGGSGGDSDESLGQSFTGQSSTDTDEKKRVKKDRTPKSTVERKGWRKWHRKCTRCTEDMHKKWRDPSIKWICGAYQRARRSFKSLCMMHYRNCQDGTMFTKIADHRCPNASGQIRPYGDHFFYEYNVVLTEDDTDSGAVESTSMEESSSSWSEAKIATIPPMTDEQ